ncbi:MAG: 30S ribosome-binding factor RbfA [Candidatus Omnitrophota bacterium]
MASNRADKIGGALKKKVSQIIQAHVRDPRVGFITVTDVKMSADMKYVKIFFTALGDEKVKKSALIGLKQATGFIRKHVADEMSLRFVPDITFKYDDTFEYGQHINELLERIKKEEEERRERNQSDQ